MGARAPRNCGGTGVGVCSVVGFPLGATTPDVKQYEARRAIFDGATEIDMVLNVGALKSGECGWSPTTSRRRRRLHRARRGQQGDPRDGAADRRGEGDGLHAGEGGRRGLREDVDGLRPWRRHRGRRRADAARGGQRDGREGLGRVRDLQQVKAMVAAGATRIGASAGVRIVKESRGETTPAAKASGY